jgi:uncharacterized membrane protein YozB (DUF420 family)
VEQYVAQINLVFQVVVMAVLFLSLGLKTRKKFVLHGATMLVAFLLYLISFSLVMLPSLLNLQEFIVNYPSSRLSIAIVVHAVLGGLTDILSLWIIVSWRLRSNIQSCVRKKMIMRVTLMLWLTVLVLGIVTYVYLWVGY